MAALKPYVDSFGRVHDDLRVSVTDRCNLRCAYCMPLEPVWFPRDELLSYEELRDLVELMSRRGVRKVRITGGEPLVRKDLPRFVSLLRTIPAIEDISLTTNGALLDRLARELADAGLRRLNVSLDTLRADRFAAMTRRDAFERTMDGLAAATDAGLAPIKINTVLLRGLNEDEVEPLVARAREMGWEIRFIEYMPLENDGSWNFDRVVRGSEVRQRIARRWPLRPDPAGDPHAPARRYLFADGAGAVGFIDSVSRPFCSACSRLRLTCDGKLRVCLYDDNEVDLKAPLRGGVGDAAIDGLIDAAIRGKGRGGALEILERKSAPARARTMHQIGG